MLDQVLAIEPRNTLALSVDDEVAPTTRESERHCSSKSWKLTRRIHTLSKSIELYRDDSPRAPVPRPTAVPEASPVSIAAATTDISETNEVLPVLR